VYCELDLTAEVDLGEADVTVIVPFNIVQVGELRRIEFLNQPFGENGHAIRSTEGSGFDDRTLDDVENAAEPDRMSVKLFSDNRQSRARSLADAESKDGLPDDPSRRRCTTSW
jgi:hypothetical protein